jgi:hypothetical protein
MPAIWANTFLDGARAGFCLMGACQDCLNVVRARAACACSTPARAGMTVKRT